MSVNQILISAIRADEIVNVNLSLVNKDVFCFKTSVSNHDYFDYYENHEHHLFDGEYHININEVRESFDLQFHTMFYRPDLFCELMNFGAIDVNITDENGMSLLHHASKILPDREADINTKNNRGNTPLDLICHYDSSNGTNYTDTIELLKEAAHNRTTINLATVNSMKDIIASNINDGIVDVRNSTTTELPQINYASKISSSFSHNAKGIIAHNNTDLSSSNNTTTQSSSSSYVNESASLMFIGYLCACVYRKIFSHDSPSTVINEPLPDQISKLQLNK